MKKLLKIGFIIISLFAVMTSCEKGDDELMLESNTGTLVIYLMNDGIPVSETSIRLYYDYAYNNDNSLSPLMSKTTDSSGKINFGELNSGNYYVSGYSQYSGTLRKQVQVILGKENSYTINQ